MPNTIFQELAAAANLPRVDYGAHLVAELAMLGIKIIPEDLWDELGKALCEADWCNEKLEDFFEGESNPKFGFQVESNHARGENHDTWQFFLSEDYGKGKKGGEWCIPVEELQAMHSGGWGYSDMVTVTRIFFRGTEDELRAKVKKLIKWIKED